MTDHHPLRLEYLHNVCGALTEYLKAGHSLRIESNSTDGKLEITFALDAADTFHTILESQPNPTPPTEPTSNQSAA